MPVYNEEASIESVVLEHVQILEKLKPRLSEWEVVCVDDASHDRSPAILAELSRKEPRLRVLRNTTNLGIHGAVARCYQEAHGAYIYFTGSDGQWPAENLLPLWERLATGADLVVGVRTNRHEVYTVSRRLISHFYNLLPRLLFGVAVRDAGSVKVGSRAIFQFDLVSTSPFSEAERIIRAVRAGYKVSFLPIRFVPRAGGEARGGSWKNIRASLRDVFRCLLVYGFR